MTHVLLSGERHLGRFHVRGLRRVRSCAPKPASRRSLSSPPVVRARALVDRERFPRQLSPPPIDCCDARDDDRSAARAAMDHTRLVGCRICRQFSMDGLSQGHIHSPRVLACRYRRAGSAGACGTRRRAARLCNGIEPRRGTFGRVNTSLVTLCAFTDARRAHWPCGRDECVRFNQCLRTRDFCLG